MRETIAGASYGLNIFGFPAVATGGAVMIPHVVSVEGVNPGLGPDTNYSFNAVLLNEAGEFVEVAGLPADISMEMGIPCYGKLRSLFFGGDSGVMINPFVAPGTMALVDTLTGATRLVPRPTLQIPMALSLMPGQRQNIMYYTDDLCKNMVGRIREGVICFPAQTESTADSGTISLVTLDLLEDALEIRGPMPEGVPTTPAIGGIAKPSAVQYEVIGEDGQLETPAILLWGVGGGYARAAISFDSGYTWHELSSEVGPARAAWYAGSAIHAPLPGRLWG